MNKLLKKSTAIVGSIAAASSFLFASSDVEATETPTAVRLTASQVREKINSKNYYAVEQIQIGDTTYTYYEKAGSKNYTGEKDYMGLSITPHEYVTAEITIGKVDSFGTSFTTSAGASVGVEAGVKIWGIGASVGFETEVETSLVIEKIYEVPRSKTATIDAIKDGQDPSDLYLYNKTYTADYLVVGIKYGQYIGGFEAYNQPGVNKELAFLSDVPESLKIAVTIC